MSAESVTLRAIKITRIVLGYALEDGQLLVYMADNDVAPGDVEDEVTEILEYLDKTTEEEKPAREDDAKILEIAERYIYQPTDFEEYNKELNEKGFKERTPPEKKPHEPEGEIIPNALRLLDDWEKAGLGDYVVNGKYVDALRAKLGGRPHG